MRRHATSAVQDYLMQDPDGIVALFTAMHANGDRNRATIVVDALKRVIVLDPGRTTFVVLDECLTGGAWIKIHNDCLGLISPGVESVSLNLVDEFEDAFLLAFNEVSCPIETSSPGR